MDIKNAVLLVKAFQKSSHCTCDVSGLLVLCFAVLLVLGKGGKKKPWCLQLFWTKSCSSESWCCFLQCGTEQLQCFQHVMSYWREATTQEQCSLWLCVSFIQLSHSLDVAVFLVGAGDFFHASFSIKHLWNKINRFSCSSVFTSFLRNESF